MLVPHDPGVAGNLPVSAGVGRYEAPDQMASRTTAPPLRNQSSSSCQAHHVLCVVGGVSYGPETGGRAGGGELAAGRAPRLVTAAAQLGAAAATAGRRRSCGHGGSCEQRSQESCPGLPVPRVVLGRVVSSERGVTGGRIVLVTGRCGEGGAC